MDSRPIFCNLCRRVINMKTKCIVCRGTGALPLPFARLKDGTELKKRMAVVLVKNGFSYRQVAKFLGWKSPRSVSVAMQKKSTVVRG